MIKVMSVSQVRADIYNVMDEIAQTHEPVLITGKRNNVVMLSKEDWNAIEGTLYLNTMNESDEEFSENQGKCLFRK